MLNNAHRKEALEDRIRRFRGGSYAESIETLLNSLDNFLNNEVKQAIDNGQTSLLFLGIHASALTLAEAFYDQSGLSGYRRFVEVFMDGEEENEKFSLISETIHDWRNILAHQWLGELGHRIEYDYGMQSGWREVDGMLFINPRIYGEAYLSSFSPSGSLWRYREIFNAEELEAIKSRIVHKFTND